MKREKHILEALNDTDEHMLEQAEIRKVFPITWKKRWIFAAACMALIIAGGIGVWQSGFWESDVVTEDTRWLVRIVQPGETVAATTCEDIWLEKTGEEQSFSERFREATWNGKTFITTEHVLQAEDVGEALGTVTVSAAEWLTSGEAIIREAEAQVYAVAGIAEDLAIALKPADEETFGVYVNHEQTFATLEDFITAANLKETLTFGDVSYSVSGEGYYGEVTIIVPEEKLWALLENTTAVCVQDRMVVNKLNVSVSIPILGQENQTLGITEDGYLWTNLIPAGVSFYIGEEQTQAFIEYVLNYCEGTETRYLYPETKDNSADGNSDIVIEHTSKAQPPQTAAER